MCANGEGMLRNGSETSYRDEPAFRDEPGMESDENDVFVEELIKGETTTAAEEEEISTNTTPDRSPNPFQNASFFSRLVFNWPYPLMKLGMKRTITDSDLSELMVEDSSPHNLSAFSRIWNDELARVERINSKKKRKKKIRPNLHRAIVVDYLKKLWFIQPMFAAGGAAMVGQVLVLGKLIEYFDTGTANKNGYVLASYMALCGLVILLEHHHAFFFNWREGMRIRLAATAAIFDKSLRLGSIGSNSNGGKDKNTSKESKFAASSKKSASSGTVINLATNDVERFILAALFLPYLFWSPVCAIAVLVVGVYLIGVSFVAGYIVLFLFVPLQFYLSKRFAELRSKVAAITDERVTLVSQAVAGVRVMKMSGWELQFDERIANVRRKEMLQIQRASRLKALNEAVFFLTNIVVAMITFLVHIYRGGSLTPQNVFTTLSLTNIAQIQLTKYFSLAVMGISECHVSISRIQRFLELPESLKLSHVTKEQSTSAKESTDKSTPPLLAIENLTCHWNGNEHRDTDLCDKTGNLQEEDPKSNLILALDDINLTTRPGELTFIIGAVGSGKSALIQAIAGELPPSRGCIYRQPNTTMAYASQDSWIMDGTVRENILMGRPFEQSWYTSVVQATGLSVDFVQFRDGDATIVGDRGVQCSGGQRARIGLARALYRDADILLLDDPLSAVDSKVGRLIFYSAIQELALKRSRCVILASHQHQFIGQSKCLLMARGKVACVGTYDECVAASGGVLTTVAHNAENEKNSTSTRQQISESVDGGKMTPNTVAVKQNESDTDELNTSDDKGKSQIGSGEDDGQNEMNVTGNVQLSTFADYAHAMGGVWIGISLLLLFVGTQTLLVLTFGAFGKWSERPAEEQTSPSIIGLVAGLVCAVFFFATTRALASFFFTLKASQTLHDQMTSAVLRAKIEFFDTNPLGRILNRFSADVGTNDDMLPTTLFDFLVSASIVAGAVITTFSVLPFTLLALPPLLLYFVRVRKIFVTTSRELKRLDGIARSPMFALLSEALSGIATLRANDAVDYFREKFESAQDAHTRVFFGFLSCSRWLGFRMDTIMFILTVGASFSAVLIHERGWFNIDPALLGLSLTMLLQVASLFQWSVRQSAEVVNQMVAVERVLAFSKLTPEADLDKIEDKKLTAWPQSGRITFDDLQVRYRSSLPPSLTNVTFSIESGQRIGVVGRTGSGKSTLVQALFRILEAEQGSISIDGVDISTVGLHKVRNSISVIPQTPVLFSGCTVRENLDPFYIYNDERIHEALSDVQMLDEIDDLQHGLDSTIAEGGSNFSVGQRQLICLARAILRKNKILVLDEATANVDTRTDELLQQAVAKSFMGSTIIAVAHRLDTVISYDKILVLGNGSVLEYGSPRELLLREDGHFSSMVKDTGEQMSANLRNQAFQR
mmetsp:Transcript_18358/g.26582  ORF Transcript_18358/g.26582 Transcript_18358/m.26582 type:complete len:1406 (-) Transcript_18358:280-4497(-)